MSVTLPSDLFVPEVALEHVGVEFVTSLQAMQFIGADAASPMQIVGFENLVGGGQFVTAPIIDRISSLESRRDITSEADATPAKFSTREDDGVLLNRKIGPVSITKSAVDLAKIRPGQLELEFARQAARVMLETIQAACIAAAKGAVSAMSTTEHTQSDYVASGTKANLNTERLLSFIELMGDRADMLTAWIFRSRPFYGDLAKNQLGAGVMGIADRVAAGASPLTIGRNYAIVDDSNLYTAVGGSYDKWYTLGLGPRAIEIEFTRPLDIPLPELRLKNENREIIMRGDYDFTVRVPGFAFDNATANPTTANLATSAKWTANYGDHREVKIVLGEHNATAS